MATRPPPTLPTKPCPSYLSLAFDWIAAAGEIEELAAMNVRAAAKYATAAARGFAANAEEHWTRYGTVTRMDVVLLHRWLRGLR